MENNIGDILIVVRTEFMWWKDKLCWIFYMQTMIKYTLILGYTDTIKIKTKL